MTANIHPFRSTSLTATSKAQGAELSSLQDDELRHRGNNYRMT
ncbi:hypothetical protein [Bradyrhizobium sp. LTSP849]|nr:hypothetical protein [Bradyrhizobium sp. LTSP849]